MGIPPTESRPIVGAFSLVGIDFTIVRIRGSFDVIGVSFEGIADSVIGIGVSVDGIGDTFDGNVNSVEGIPVSIDGKADSDDGNGELSGTASARPAFLGWERGFAAQPREAAGSFSGATGGRAGRVRYRGCVLQVGKVAS